ncbi:MAG: hypothetical protein QXZ02_04155 [Candidatus Bathyarchaeia archaeon]
MNNDFCIKQSLSSSFSILSWFIGRHNWKKIQVFVGAVCFTLRDDLIKLKVEHRSAEEKLQYYLQAGNMELTKIVSDRLNMLFKEIKEPKKKLRNSKAYFCRIIPFLIFI